MVFKDTFNQCVVLSRSFQTVFNLFIISSIKNVHFEWDEHCQKAFDDLKDYLLSSPVLTPPREGEPFYLYISVTDHALGAMISHRDAN
ncbi:hypothetical protein KI387_036835, partial [Taxus chinensis]